MATRAEEAAVVARKRRRVNFGLSIFFPSLASELLVLRGGRHRRLRPSHVPPESSLGHGHRACQQDSSIKAPVREKRRGAPAFHPAILFSGAQEAFDLALGPGERLFHRLAPPVAHGPLGPY